MEISVQKKSCDEYQIEKYLVRVKSMSDDGKHFRLIGFVPFNKNRCDEDYPQFIYDNKVKEFEISESETAYLTLKEFQEGIERKQYAMEIMKCVEELVVKIEDELH